MKIYAAQLDFIEPIIGTVPMNKEIYSDFVESKRPPENDMDDEVDTVVEALEKGVTGFHTDTGNPDGKPVLYDYVIKGFFKDACGMLRRVSNTKSSKLQAYKKIIDGLIFIEPRLIYIIGGEKGMIERPLRAQTAKGERVALAKSEMISGDARIGFTIKILGGVSRELLIEWMEYGQMRGLGQWRNARYGSFKYTLVEGKENKLGDIIRSDKQWSNA